MALQKRYLKKPGCPLSVSRLEATDSVSKMKLQDLGLLIHWNVIYNLSPRAGMEVI